MPTTKPAARRLIVNADDFGLSPGVNAGIILAHREGILTSATLLANAPGFDEAVALAADNPRMGVGLHLNLVRGRPLSPPEEAPELTAAGGRLRPFRLRRMTAAFLAQAEAEYRRQFERVLAAGIAPTHIDFEKHHAVQASLYRLACGLAREYGVPAVRTFREPTAWAIRRLGWPGWRRVLMAAALRCGTDLLGAGTGGLSCPDRMLGQSHIGAMDEAVWLRLIRHLPAGVSEVMTHPGLPDAPAAVGDMGCAWLADARALELAALTSPGVRRAVEAAGIALVCFRELAEDAR